MTIPHQPEAKCDGDPSRLPSDAGPPSRPDTGDVSVSGLAGIIVVCRGSPIQGLFWVLIVLKSPSAYEKPPPWLLHKETVT